MEGWIFVAVVVVGLSLPLIGGMAKVLGKCSRQEEEEERKRMKDG